MPVENADYFFDVGKYGSVLFALPLFFSFVSVVFVIVSTPLLWQGLPDCNRVCLLNRERRQVVQGRCLCLKRYGSTMVDPYLDLLLRISVCRFIHAMLPRLFLDVSASPVSLL